MNTILDSTTQSNSTSFVYNVPLEKKERPQNYLTSRYQVAFRGYTLLHKLQVQQSWQKESNTQVVYLTTVFHDFFFFKGNGKRTDLLNSWLTSKSIFFSTRRSYFAKLILSYFKHKTEQQSHRKVINHVFLVKLFSGIFNTNRRGWKENKFCNVSYRNCLFTGSLTNMLRESS